MIDADGSVKQSVVVSTDTATAFDVFTTQFDSWWPRTHHIGKSPMTKGLIEGFVGGRCYSEQADGTDCAWGHVLAWDPPRRLVIAWQITHEWGFQADPSLASEVEILFTDLGDGRTRVDLAHRHFERMGPGGDTMRTTVDSPGGWGSLLELYAARVAQIAGGHA